MKTTAHLNRVEATGFLRWCYGDQPAQVIYGERWTAEEVPLDGIDALLDRVGDQPFYFAVCTLKPAWGATTPEPDHAVQARYVWFDFDAKKFGDKDTPPSDASQAHYGNESYRIATTLKAAWERLGVKPSATWFSGGGQQGLFCLDRPIPPERAEALSRKLAAAIGSDASVCNRNRVLRIPGSVNQKTEHGRRPTETNVMDMSDRIITVEGLESALAEVKLPERVAPVGKLPKVQVDWARVEDFKNVFTIETLRTRGVAEFALNLLEHGDADHKYPTDSEMGFAIAGALFRAGLSPEEEAGVLGTKSFPGNVHFNELSAAKRKRGILNAINNSRTKSLAAQRREAMGAPEWRDYDEKVGIFPQPTLANAVIGIKSLGVECRLDLFHNTILMSLNGETEEVSNLVGELSDNALRAIRSHINNKWHLDLGEKHVFDGAMEIALDHAFDPVLDYLDSVEWDGVPRLSRAAVDYFNAPDTPLNCAMIEATLIGSVRRARHPGCKFDTIMILESKEGFNKSSAIRALYGDQNYSDQTVLGVSDREVQEQLAGVWGHECADLSGMGKTEVERVKAFASRQVDRARPAYGRVNKKQPRRCVLWATTNDSEYLQSQNGNRRMWPMEVMQSIDLEKLERDRDQLWAEATHRESEIPPDVNINIDRALWAAAGEAQEARRVTDPWEDILESMPSELVIGDPTYPDATRRTIIHKTDAPEWKERINTQDLLVYVLRIPPERQTNATAKRLSTVMRRLGWQKSKGAMRVGGELVRGFWRPDPNAPPQGTLALEPGKDARAA